MLKLIIIFIFLYIVAFVLWRVFSAAKPKPPLQVELKACEFCGTLVRVDQAIKVHGRLFCSQNHANRMR